jgi:signal transduction histidine kinase
MKQVRANLPTVLVVDDDRGLVRLVEKALQREGLLTAGALSGHEAIQWLQQHQPDLMLLDLHLQDVQGKDLLERLRQLKRAVPFIVITGQGDERVAVEMMKGGAMDYLVKDANFLQFVPEVVRRTLARLEQERKLAEMEETRKRLEKEILQISELEQRRIGQDLHDGLCQHLAGIELMSQALEQRLASQRNENASRAADIARHVRDSIAQTRSLARGLSPVELDENGLMSALQQLAASVQNLFQVKCDFRCEIPVLVPDNVMATHLFRIAQEAVSNAIKHGKAKRIQIALTPHEDKLTLAISDNGHGFPNEPGKGMGLRIMNYRAGMLGGALSVRNEKNDGASVICSVPRSVFKTQS